jgi:hypothetical protein
MASETEQLRDELLELRRAWASFVERRGGADRRAEFREWSEGVYKGIAATQSDLVEVKKDVKGLTATVSTMATDIALLKRDHEISEERWEEVRTILGEIKVRGCDVYAEHRRIQTEAAKVAVETAKVANEVVKVGRTWVDFIVEKFNPTNIVLIGVILLLVLFLKYHEQVVTLFGILPKISGNG